MRTSVRATANLATKQDLENVKTALEKALEHQTEALQSGLRVEVHKAINAQTWRFVAATGAMLGLLRWLFPTTLP